jgi:hypothetical protein
VSGPHPPQFAPRKSHLPPRAARMRALLRFYRRFTCPEAGKDSS